MAEDKKVKGNDPVKVYATKALVEAGIATEGEEMEVHAEQAEKLIAAGKATKTAPKGK